MDDSGELSPIASRSGRLVKRASEKIIDFNPNKKVKSIIFSLALLTRRPLLEAIGGSSPESSMSQNTSIGDLCVSYDRKEWKGLKYP